MPIAKEKLPISFKALPVRLAELSENLFQEALPSVAILSLTTIDRITDQELNNWLDKKEIQQLTTYTHNKRNREWLGGRICAKEGLHIFLRQREKMEHIPHYPQCRVRNEESGRPYFAALAGGNFSLPELSITHSKGLAAALISPSHCGIDIQYASEKLPRVKKRFCTPDEEQLLQDALPQLSVLSQLTVLWAAKEAVKKMLSPGGIPGFHELNLQQLTPQETNNAALYFSRTTNPGPLFPVAAGILNKEYALALCCQTE